MLFIYGYTNLAIHLSQFEGTTLWRKRATCAHYLQAIVRNIACQQPSGSQMSSNHFQPVLVFFTNAIIKTLLAKTSCLLDNHLHQPYYLLILFLRSTDCFVPRSDELRCLLFFLPNCCDNEIV